MEAFPRAECADPTYPYCIRHRSSLRQEPPEEHPYFVKSADRLQLSAQSKTSPHAY